MNCRACILVALAIGDGACHYDPWTSSATEVDLPPPDSAGLGDRPDPGPPATSGDATTLEPEPDTSTSASTGSTGGTTAEPPNSCGNALLDPGEECDYGEDNSNVGGCTLSCTKATCGDGFVWEGVEACDFGEGNNKKDYGGCTEDCEWAAKCGDGNLDVGFEECDLGDQNGTGTSVDGEAACTMGCRWHGRIVFVTSEAYSGALGGVAGADLKCTSLAIAAGLTEPGGVKFRAWLSDSTSSPLTRFTQIDDAGRPYVLLDGRVLAETFAELVTFGPRTGISLTEQGEVLFEQYVWTNTSAFGEVFSAANHCAGWTSDAFELKARFGLNALALEQGPLWDNWRDERSWTSYITDFCNFLWRLYCFEDD